MTADIKEKVARAFVLLGKALGLLAIIPAALGYNLVVWRISYYAWKMGLHFYDSPVFTADALWYLAHCLFLAVAVFLFPSYAAIRLPRLYKVKRIIFAYVAFLLAAGVVTAANYGRQYFTNPFAGRGPFFFTLGPLAWEITWPGFAFGFGAALLGKRVNDRWGTVLVGALALAGVVWYFPIIRWLSRLDAGAFVALTLVINLLSLTLRRRTGSILPGLAGHLLMKFILTW